MSEIIVNIKNMSEEEFIKTWDLLQVAQVHCTHNNNPLKSTCSIEIDLDENRHKSGLNSGVLDAALNYISKHIID
jgi:hypothetical protein